MSTKVQLPPGCYGFDCKDGTKYTGRPGGSVTVSDRHAKALNQSQFGGDANLVGNVGRVSFGTKKTRVCAPCGGRRWNAWNETCPRCGEPCELVED
jgi:hypothetical protein